MVVFGAHLGIIFVTFEGQEVKVKIELPCTREHRFEGLRDARVGVKCAKNVSKLGAKMRSTC